MIHKYQVTRKTSMTRRIG